MTDFVHLHVHSQYSFLDGAISLKTLVKKAATQKAKAVALTDHGNMFGVISFYKACKDAGLHPILGCELQVLRSTDAGTYQRPEGGNGAHLTVLARNEDGYRNLIHLVSKAWISGKSADATPRIDLALLAERAKGLVVLSGCMGGLVPQAILEQGQDNGLALANSLRDMLDPGALFLELQDHGFPEQPILNGILRDIGKQLGLKCVATNDVHYADKSDAEAQMVLRCIGEGKTIDAMRESHHGSSEMYLKTPAEMANVFYDDAEALKTTLIVNEMCELKLKLGTPMLPNFRVPEGSSTDDYFRYVSREGLEKRFSEFRLVAKVVDETFYRQRLEMELNVICQMKFPGYFLIVWDFIRHAKDNGIPVGPGRGSGAGSLVAYSLAITDIDPLPLNLLFERFLNPERVSMPDFDIDFCMDLRGRVIEYVSHKYGETSVGQIATFAELKAKSVIKDVGRTMEIPPVETQKIANLIGMKAPGQTFTIPESLEREPKLKALADTDDRIARLLDQATKLEGLTRQAGMHAAGVVISEGPLWDWVPCFTGNNGELVTQYYKEDVEQAGLVKFDFLGLKTLTVLDLAVKLVNARPDVTCAGTHFSLQAIPLDDDATYKLLQSGETKGVFQLESSGMQKLFRDLKPEHFEDVVAAVALYRPGPLGTGMVKDFVDCKHGRKPIASLHEKVDEILKPTYGVIVYQEQVMQVAQKLAGYTLGGADLLRRAMGKKKPEEMAKQRNVFIEGAVNNGVANEDAVKIFELLEFFAGYGFNKSHSAAYGLITYQTAYLKAHYPVEFVCASLSADKEKIDKVVRMIAEGRAMGIEILPPDVNESGMDFSVIYKTPNATNSPTEAKIKDPLQPAIRFGLGAVRGIGEAAIASILEARTTDFTDLFDFAGRVDAKRLNRSVLEALICSGAMDALLRQVSVTRAGAMASVERALERSRSATKDRAAGQVDMFGMFASSNDGRPAGATSDRYVDAPPWDAQELLSREKESLGFYLSGHPLDRYGEMPFHTIDEVAELNEREKVRVAGVVENYRERVMKSGSSAGQKMAFFEFEDRFGRIEVKMGPQQVEQFSDVLKSGQPVMIRGIVAFDRRANDDADEENQAEPIAQIRLDEAVILSEALARECKEVAITLHENALGDRLLSRLAEHLRACVGPCPVSLMICLRSGAEVTLGLGQKYRVSVGDRMLSGLEKILGSGAVEMRSA